MNDLEVIKSGIESIHRRIDALEATLGMIEMGLAPHEEKPVDGMSIMELNRQMGITSNRLTDANAEIKMLQRQCQELREQNRAYRNVLSVTICAAQKSQDLVDETLRLNPEIK